MNNTPAGSSDHPSPTETTRTRLVLMLLIVATAPSIGSLSGLWIWPGAFGSTIYAICKTLLYGIPAWVAWRTLTRRDLRNAFRSGCTRNALLVGTASGLLIGGGIVALWFGWLQSTVDTSRLLEVIAESGLDQGGRFWLFAAWLIIGNSLLEEVVFRWFVDSRLGGLGIRPAVAIPMSAFIFTIHHIIVLAAYFDITLIVMGSMGVFIGGLIWSWTLRRWGSIVPGWISHALVDLAIAIVGASMLGLI